MCTLTELVKREKRVWIYVRNEAVGRAFMSQLKAEGFRWANGGWISVRDWNHTMGLHDDLTLWNVSLFNWTLSFSGRIGGTPMRIDYERYAAGEEDFLCYESHFMKAGKSMSEAAVTAQAQLIGPAAERSL